jgi:hypothetical protein
MNNIFGKVSDPLIPTVYSTLNLHYYICWDIKDEMEEESKHVNMFTGSREHNRDKG